MRFIPSQSARDALYSASTCFFLMTNQEKQRIKYLLNKARYIKRQEKGYNTNLSKREISDILSGDIILQRLKGETENWIPAEQKAESIKDILKGLNL